MRGAGRPRAPISRPQEPRRIGFMPVDGGGIHRLWYVGGRWAYASALIDGFTDYILITIDMSDPTRPREAGRWWIPGMNAAAGETPNWPATRRYGLHHAIIHGDTAYAAWRDAGMVVLDVADRTKPKLITHVQTHGKGAHRFDVDENYLYLSTEMEGFVGNILVIYDIRNPARPIEVSRWWMPGQHIAAGEKPTWSGKRHRLHHALRFGDEMWASVWHGGFRIVDIADIARPRTVASYNYHPPFPEPTHTVVPVPEPVRGRRIALAIDGKTTLDDHRPVSHQAHAEGTLDRVKLAATRIGPQTAVFVEALLQRKSHPEVGLRASLGLVRLAETYAPARVEAACTRALRMRAPTLHSIRSILSRGLDREETGVERGPLPSHENIRGPDYYD